MAKKATEPVPQIRHCSEWTGLIRERKLDFQSITFGMGSVNP
jgi:hypothetical protein